MDLNNSRTGKHATKPRALGLLGHSEQSVFENRQYNIDPKVPKQAEVKRDGVINRQIPISINFNMENFDALKTTRINRSRS